MTGTLVENLAFAHSFAWVNRPRNLPHPDLTIHSNWY
jgi:hypothetical protein